MARAESAAERSGDIEARAMCGYWHDVILVTGGDPEGALQFAREAGTWAAGTRAGPGFHQIACDALRQLGDFRDAISECEAALEGVRKFGPPVREGQVLNSLGLLYHSSGQYRLAFEQYEKATKIAETVKQADFAANVKNNLGNLFAAQGGFDMALRYYEESLAIKRAGGAKRQILSTLMNRADLGTVMGRHDLSRKYLAEAFPLAEEVSNRPMLAFCYKERGMLELDEGKLDAAVSDLKQALEGVSPLDAMPVTVHLGTALLEKGDAGGALPYAERVRAAADEAGYLEARWGARNLLAKIYRTQGKTAEAEAGFRSAIAIIEDLRNNVAGVEEDRQRYLQDKLEPYRGLFSLLIGAARPEDAFAVAEQTKARVLAEVIGSGRLRITKGMTPAEQEREETLRRLLAAVRQSRAVTARADTDRAATEYAEFQAALYTSHPELALRRTRFDPARPAEIAAQLGDSRSAAVEYVLTNDAVFAMAITGGDATVHFYKLAVSPSALAEKAARFRTALAGRELGFQPLGRELYQLLLAPVKEAQRKKTLVFVPEGPLWQVPFQALQNAGGRYLIQDAAVSYAPSMTVLAQLRRRKAERPSGPSAILAMGNPLLAPASGLAELPTAQREVIEIGRLYGAENSRILTGAEASKSVLRDQSRQYSVLHLATHGVLDARNPMYSHLYLAAHGEDSGILEAWEVMGLELHEEMVILSACEMARGAVGGGEGLIGMSWAMFVAGSPTTVASQWKADAASTSMLMADFHRGLRQRVAGKPEITKAEALRRAAMGRLSKGEFSHPYYWAAFVMLGDGS